MKIPFIKAKDKDTGIEYQGFYFEYPSTTYCITEDYYRGNAVKLVPCLVKYRMTDWGLPNIPEYVYPIDKESIEIIGYVDTDNNDYFPDKWIKRGKGNCHI